MKLILDIYNFKHNVILYGWRKGRKLSRSSQLAIINENKYIMDDLFDDTKIKEESVPYKKTRIGKMYQVDI